MAPRRAVHVFKVLPGSRVLQSVPTMPYFKTGTAEYSMDIGMHENPFTLDARGHPPFADCKCGHEPPVRKQ